MRSRLLTSVLAPVMVAAALVAVSPQAQAAPADVVAARESARSRAAVDFNGSYRLASSENYDAYLQAAGAGLAVRQILNSTTPTTVITVSGTNWTIKTESSFKNVESTFTLGSPFQQETLDGRILTSVATLSADGTALAFDQNLNGQTSTDTIALNDTGFAETLSINDGVATRVYKRA